MLKELRCEKLIEKRLEFKIGLNALTGPDDGANSIGKSSVLMLLDFAFAGDAFIKLCSDVIDNIGNVTIEMDFVFGTTRHSFSRCTNDPKIVLFLSDPAKPEKTLEEYRSFLKKSYLFPEFGSSFRGAVNPFFRIWGKDNYNPNRPLHSFPGEAYSHIRPNLLKLFSLYGTLSELDKVKISAENKKSILKGAFNEGYLIPLTKIQEGKSESRLKEIELAITELKSSLENHSINANQIINEDNLKIKSEKDEHVNRLFQLKNRLRRIDDNLAFGTTTNRKYFEKLKDYFPEVNIEKLAKVDQFHSGVAIILRAELREEKSLLEEQIQFLEAQIRSSELKLIQSVKAIGNPSALIDKLLELSSEEKDLREGLKFREIKTTIDEEVAQIEGKIIESQTKALATIENTLNSAMSNYIDKYYEGNPVPPKIKISENRYEFQHNEDSGTGKSYANMIALDMSILDNTYLPALIHDLIVFSNIEDHAIEEIIKEYTLTKKQVFIAIDKIKRFGKITQDLVKSKEFLALDSENLAFGKSWKNRTPIA